MNNKLDKHRDGNLAKSESAVIESFSIRIGLQLLKPEIRTYILAS